MLENLENNGTEEICLVTPTPVLQPSQQTDRFQHKAIFVSNASDFSVCIISTWNMRKIKVLLIVLVTLSIPYWKAMWSRGSIWRKLLDSKIQWWRLQFMCYWNDISFKSCSPGYDSFWLKKFLRMCVMLYWFNQATCAHCRYVFARHFPQCQ